MVQDFGFDWILHLRNVGVEVSHLHLRRPLVAGAAFGTTTTARLLSRNELCELGYFRDEFMYTI